MSLGGSLSTTRPLALTQPSISWSIDVVVAFPEERPTSFYRAAGQAPGETHSELSGSPTAAHSGL